jgi:predicted DNA-binding protein
MEVHFTPEVEKKLNDLAAQSGMTAAALVQDAVVGMFDELAATHDMLDRRYDEIKSGKVKLIPGDEAFRRLMAKTEAERSRPT